MPVTTRSCGRKTTRRRIEDPTPARPERKSRTTPKRRKAEESCDEETPPKKKVNTTKSICEKLANKKEVKSKIPRRCATAKHPTNSMCTPENGNNEEANYSEVSSLESPKRTDNEAFPSTPTFAARTRSYTALKRSYMKKKKYLEVKLNAQEAGALEKHVSSPGNREEKVNKEDAATALSTEVKEVETENTVPYQVENVDSSSPTCDNGSNDLEMMDVNENKQEITSNEEDVQYFKTRFQDMAHRLKDMQENFNVAQQHAQQNIKAYDNFIKELKDSLKNEKQRNCTIEEELSNGRSQLLLAEKELEDIRSTGFNQHQENQETKGDQSLTGKEKEENSMNKFYSMLTGISLSNDEATTNSFESYQCIYQPRGPNGKAMLFRLTLDKEFEEIEYSPNFQSPNKEEIVQCIPKSLRENIYFGPDQAPGFLARLIKSLPKL